MILNMTGSNEVQIVDFTLSEDVNLQAQGLDIDNVYLPDGTFSEFAIFPSSVLYVTNETITHIYSPNNISKVSQSGLFLVYWRTSSGYNVQNDAGTGSEPETYVSYDAINKKLHVTCSLSFNYLRAGDYRLVIW